MKSIESEQFSLAITERENRLKTVAGLTAVLSAIALSGCSVDNIGAAPVERGELKSLDEYSEYAHLYGLNGYKYTYTNAEGGTETVLCSPLSYSENGPERQIHTVEAGETLTDIANGVDLYWSYLDQATPSKEAIVDIIAEMNGITDENVINVGQVLDVPARCDTPR